jgi:hypothetical protein
MIKILPPRTPFLDEKTGLMAREWYRFFEELGGEVNVNTGNITDVDAIITSVESSILAIPEYGAEAAELKKQLGNLPIALEFQPVADLAELKKALTNLSTELLMIQQPNHELQKRINDIEIAGIF